MISRIRLIHVCKIAIASFLLAISTVTSCADREIDKLLWSYDIEPTMQNKIDLQLHYLSLNSVQFDVNFIVSHSQYPRLDLIDSLQKKHSQQIVSPLSETPIEIRNSSALFAEFAWNTKMSYEFKDVNKDSKLFPYLELISGKPFQGKCPDLTEDLDAPQMLAFFAASIPQNSRSEPLASIKRQVRDLIQKKQPVETILTQILEMYALRSRHLKLDSDDQELLKLISSTESEEKDLSSDFLIASIKFKNNGTLDSIKDILRLSGNLNVNQSAVQLVGETVLTSEDNKILVMFSKNNALSDVEISGMMRLFNYSAVLDKPSQAVAIEIINNEKVDESARIFAVHYCRDCIDVDDTLLLALQNVSLKNLPDNLASELKICIERLKKFHRLKANLRSREDADGK